ncbi:MAG: hypothetical protein QXV69_03660 [Sulfolobaceae archaeon]
MKYNFTTAELYVTFFWNNITFKVTGTINYIINYSNNIRYSNYTINYNSDDIFTGLYKIMQGSLLGPSDLLPNFNSYQIVSYKLGNIEIPAIKFTDSQGNFLMLDLKYGVPLSGYYKGSVYYYNFTLSYTNTIFPSNFTLYYIDLIGRNFTYNLSIITSKLMNIELGNFTQNYGNISSISNFLQISTNNFTLLIFPSDSLYKIVLNGYTSGVLKIVYRSYNDEREKSYYLIVDTTSERILLLNKSLPFYPILLKNLFLEYFPQGGNITLYFGNYKYIISKINITEKNQQNNTFINWYIYIIIPVVIIIIILLAYRLLKRR